MIEDYTKIGLNSFKLSVTISQNFVIPFTPNKISKLEWHKTW